jgi:hypothetical protein
MGSRLRGAASGEGELGRGAENSWPCDAAASPVSKDKNMVI